MFTRLATGWQHLDWLFNFQPIKVPKTMSGQRIFFFFLSGPVLKNNDFILNFSCIDRKYVKNCSANVFLNYSQIMVQFVTMIQVLFRQNKNVSWVEVKIKILVKIIFVRASWIAKRSKPSKSLDIGAMGLFSRRNEGS